MSRDKGQVFIFSDAELDLIKKTFADNEELLYAIRKVLLQFDLTEAEKESIKAQVTPEVFAVLKKKLLPEISPDAPFNQLADLRQTLTNDLKTKTPEEMAPLFEAKKLVIQYLEQQMEELEGSDTRTVSARQKPISLAKLAVIYDDHYWNFVNTTARNFILGFVDPMLQGLYVLAGSQNESQEKMKERISRNSTK